MSMSLARATAETALPPFVKRMHPAAGVAALGFVILIELNMSWDGISGPQWFALPSVPILAIALYLPLLWLERYPRIVFAYEVIGAMILGLTIPGFLPRFGAWLALYAVAANCRRRDALLALAASLGPSLLGVVSE